MSRERASKTLQWAVTFVLIAIAMLVIIIAANSANAWSPDDMTMDTWTARGKAVVRVFPYDGSQSYIHQFEFERSVVLNYWNGEGSGLSLYDFYLTDAEDLYDVGHFYVYYDGVNSSVNFEYTDYNDGYYQVVCFAKKVNTKSMKGKSTFVYEGNSGYGVGVGTCSLRKNK